MYGNCRYQDFFWGAMIGGTVATLTTLLFTTKKGKELQDRIVDKYQDVEDNMKNLADSSKNKLEEAGETAKKVTGKEKKEDHNHKGKE